MRFRSVVHSDILSERPATLDIILMPRPTWDRRNVEAGRRRTRTGATVRVDNEASPCVQSKKMIGSDQEIVKQRSSDSGC